MRTILKTTIYICILAISSVCLASEQIRVPERAFSVQATMIHFDNGTDEIPSLNGYGASIRYHFFQSVEKNVDLNFLFTFLPYNKDEQRDTPMTMYLGCSIDIGLLPMVRYSDRGYLHSVLGVGMLRTEHFGLYPDPDEYIIFPASSGTIAEEGTSYKYYLDHEPMFHYGIGGDLRVWGKAYMCLDIIGYRYLLADPKSKFVRDTKYQISIGLSRHW